MTLDTARETVMLGWRRGMARLAILGNLKGGLFIDDCRGNAWVVSHERSGKRLAAFRVEFNAYAFAEAALAMADWTEIADTDDLRAGLAEEVRALGATFEDCSLNYE